MREAEQNAMAGSRELTNFNQLPSVKRYMDAAYSRISDLERKHLADGTGGPLE